MEGFATGLSVAGHCDCCAFLPPWLYVSPMAIVAVANRMRATGLFSRQRFERGWRKKARKTRLPYAMADRPPGIKTWTPMTVASGVGIMAVAKLVMEARSR